jgi:hypothetical protein
MGRACCGRRVKAAATSEPPPVTTDPQTGEVVQEALVPEPEEPVVPEATKTP